MRVEKRKESEYISLSLFVCEREREKAKSGLWLGSSGRVVMLIQGVYRSTGEYGSLRISGS